MRQVLRLHPDYVCAAVSRIEVDVARPAPGLLALRFVAGGATDGLILPAPAAPVRTDELWRRTCFEAFVQTPGDQAYCEFNLSPSTAWAAYRFEGYRRGMAAADIPAPRIERQAEDNRFELSAVLDLGRTGLPPDGPWRVGLSAVIQDADGATSYWALAHPPGKPDFHQADCFALELPAVQAS